MNVRLADTDDAASIREIYAPYVMNTAVSFEYNVPDVNEFEKRISNTLAEYPYLVAVDGGKITGYAYAGPFRTREAYRHSAEVSIYIAPEFHGRGIGRMLYSQLEKMLVKQNVFLLYACITETEREADEHLTNDSIRFHEKMGYTAAGRHYLCGYKFDKWYSMIWMEKVIAPRPDHPGPFIPFPQLTGQL